MYIYILSGHCLRKFVMLPNVDECFWGSKWVFGNWGKRTAGCNCSQKNLLVNVMRNALSTDENGTWTEPSSLVAAHKINGDRRVKPYM